LNFVICIINDYELRELHESLQTLNFEVWTLNFMIWTTNYANCANPCKPQSSKVKGTYHKVQCSMFKVQSKNS